MADPIPSDAYLLLIGAMRCGTSSLFELLATHPAICPSRVKEPEFFSRNQGHRLPLERYEELWDFDAARHRFALEASTGYTKWPLETGVAGRIRDHGCRPRLLYILRDPGQRIVSHLNTFFTPKGQWPALEETHALAISDYYAQLEPFRACFGREAILLLDFAELTRAPQRTLDRVTEFLHLPALELPARVAASNATPTASEAEGQLRRSGIGGALRRLPAPVKALGRRMLRRISRPERRELTPSERDLIHRTLAPNMARLHQEYGVDVSAWGF